MRNKISKEFGKSKQEISKSQVLSLTAIGFVPRTLTFSRDDLSFSLSKQTCFVEQNGSLSHTHPHRSEPPSIIIPLLACKACVQCGKCLKRSCALQVLQNCVKQKHLKPVSIPVTTLTLTFSLCFECKALKCIALTSLVPQMCKKSIADKYDK